MDQEGVMPRRVDVSRTMNASYCMIFAAPLFFAACSGPQAASDDRFGESISQFEEAQSDSSARNTVAELTGKLVVAFVRKDADLIQVDAQWNPTPEVPTVILQVHVSGVTFAGGALKSGAELGPNPIQGFYQMGNVKSGFMVVGAEKYGSIPYYFSNEPSMMDYEIDAITGAVEDGGSNEEVSITIIGSYGQIGPVPIANLGLTEGGRAVQAIPGFANVGPLKSITINIHDTDGNKGIDGWFIGSITVRRQYTSQWLHENGLTADTAVESKRFLFDAWLDDRRGGRKTSLSRSQ